MNGKRVLSFNTIALILLVLISSIFAVSGYHQVPDTATATRFFFPNSGGPVLFNHQEHSEGAEGCESCHHHLYSADLISDCLDCHDDDIRRADYSHAELKKIEDHECGYCHEIHEVRKAQNCRQCHSQASAEAGSVAICSSCHEVEADGEDYADLDVTHEELLDIHDNDCSSCHQPETISSVYHIQCINCHEQESAHIFGKLSSEWECQSCHLK